MTFEIFLFIVLILFVFKYCSPNSRLKEYGDKLPGPSAYPIIGNGLVFYTSKTMIQALHELCQSYGPVLRLWLGSKLWICLCDPADIGVFLNSTKHLNKSDLLRLLDSWLGTKGLVTSNADVWRVHRKLLTPCFHFKILQESLDMIQKNAEILCDQLKPKEDQTEFDILEYVEKCSLDIICETAMGVRLQTQVLKHSIYLESLKKVKNSTINRLFKAWLHPEFIFQLSNYGRIYYKKLNVIKEEVRKVIVERRKILQNQIQENSTDVSNVNNGRKQGKQFLDMMLTESDFTNEEIENEVQTFMFAGHDTSMTAISFCIYLLSQHQQIQDKCLEEIRKMRTLERNRKITLHDYMNLKYLENVIKETLRYYTIVPLIARKVEEDVVLPSGHFLPAGSAVNFNLLHLHRNEKYFPKADQFIPERFDNRADSMQNYAFIPFSAGSRNCIGQRFAMLEMKVIISTLLLRYQFLPAEKVKSLTLETGIVLRSLENIPVKITARNFRTY
ncbi:hypothetical protein PGB90_002212 [Kerria lacca]